jgi:hypothetical protein
MNVPPIAETTVKLKSVNSVMMITAFFCPTIALLPNCSLLAIAYMEGEQHVAVKAP